MIHPDYTQRLWLTVSQTDLMTQNTLWVREISSPFPITAGERVALLVSEEEPDGSVHHRVRSTYRDIDGTLNAELTSIIVDPDDRGELLIQTGGASPRYTSWRTTRDGELTERLCEAGWLTHQQWREYRS